MFFNFGVFNFSLSLDVFNFSPCCSEALRRQQFALKAAREEEAGDEGGDGGNQARPKAKAKGRPAQKAKAKAKGKAKAKAKGKAKAKAQGKNKNKPDPTKEDEKDDEMDDEMDDGKEEEKEEVKEEEEEEEKEEEKEEKVPEVPSAHNPLIPPESDHETANAAHDDGSKEEEASTALASKGPDMEGKPVKTPGDHQAKPRAVRKRKDSKAQTKQDDSGGSATEPKKTRKTKTKQKQEETKEPKPAAAAKVEDDKDLEGGAKENDLEAPETKGEAKVKGKKRVRSEEAQTFARRVLPTTPFGKDKWYALRAAFIDHIRPTLKHYSAHEDCWLQTVSTYILYPP